MMTIKHSALFLVLGLSLLAGTAQAAPIRLRLGSPTVAGTVSFTLRVSSTGEALAVEAFVTPDMTAPQKAVAVAGSVTAADAASTWAADVAVSTLTFRHLVGAAWVDVDAIDNLKDTSGAGTRIAVTDTVVDFTLDIKSNAVATGVNELGEPSFVTVTVTDTLTWTRPVQAGETAATVLDSFQAFLAAEKGDGVEVVRTSASSIQITLLYEDSQFNWEITDTGLQPKSTSGDGLSLKATARVIDRRRK